MDFYPLIIRQNNSQVYYLLQYSIWFLEWIYDADILLIWIIRKSKNEQFWTGYFIYVYIRGHSISTWTKWECGGRGSKNVCFCWRSGYKNCPCSEGGGRKWQNSVHVVVEWPLIYECNVWNTDFAVFLSFIRTVLMPASSSSTVFVSRMDKIRSQVLQFFPSKRQRKSDESTGYLYSFAKSFIN